MLNNRPVKIFSLTFIVLVTLLPWEAKSFYEEEAVSFTHNENKLAGSLILPNQSDGPYPIAVFVHGDGPLPYDAHGYYRYLWDELAKKGIASFSWNKPGVRDSTGNWEAQSMDERAEEVISAVEFLKNREEVIPTKIGLIGYSQAGWVIPIAAGKLEEVTFQVIVSGAINWLEQGNFFTRKRLESEGVSLSKVNDAIESNIYIARLFTPSFQYHEYINIHDEKYDGELKQLMLPMNRSRFEFAKLNWRYDVRESLKYLTSPTLFIFGKEDRNVNVLESIGVYEEAMRKSQNREFEIKVYPSAQHSILKSKYFSGNKAGFWFIVKLELLGKEAFADGYLEYVSQWVQQRVERI